MQGPLVGVLTGGVFGAVGAVIMLLGLRAIVRERATRRWPKAEGVIVSSCVDSATHQVRDAHGYYVDSTQYAPVVLYRYVVGGRTLDGTALRLSPTSMGNADKAKAISDRYAAGASVDVSYDPADPSRAYLESGTSGGAIFLTAFGGLFVAVGVLVATLVLVLGG